MKVRSRAPWPAALILAATVTTTGFVSSASAQEKGDFKDEWRNVLGAVGFGREREPIDYSPRAPIVVPPGNNLPPPVDTAARRPAGFPDDPDIASRRQALIDARRPIPPGETAGTSKARAYLIEPPAAYLDAATVAATGSKPDNGEPDAPAKKTHRKKTPSQVSAQQ